MGEAACRSGGYTTAVAAARLTETVPGVADVIDQLGFDHDDTVAAAVPATVAAAVPAAAPVHPLHGWWTRRRPTRSARGATGDRLEVDELAEDRTNERSSSH